jgi:hypothetical protein
MEKYTQNNCCAYSGCSQQGYSSNTPYLSTQSYTPMKTQIGDYQDQSNIYTTI